MFLGHRISVFNDFVRLLIASQIFVATPANIGLNQI